MLCAGSNNGGDGGSQPILQFHSTRGEHVRLSADRSTARRVDSFCKGIAFSMRTVRPNEKVLSPLPPPPPPSYLPSSLPVAPGARGDVTGGGESIPGIGQGGGAGSVLGIVFSSRFSELFTASDSRNRRPLYRYLMKYGNAGASN